MKNKAQFVCNECGTASPKWLGKCPTCGSWNSYVEELVVAKSGAGRKSSIKEGSKRGLPF